MDAMTEYFLKRFFPAQFIELRISNRGIQKKLGFVSRLGQMDNFTLIFIFLPHFKGRNVTKCNEIRLKWAIFNGSSPLLE